MDETEKASLFYYLSSIAVSLSKLTEDEEYAKETHKTAASILDTLLNKLHEELEDEDD